MKQTNVKTNVMVDMLYKHQLNMKAALYSATVKVKVKLLVT